MATLSTSPMRLSQARWIASRRMIGLAQDGRQAALFGVEDGFSSGEPGATVRELRPLNDAGCKGRIAQQTAGTSGRKSAARR